MYKNKLTNVVLHITNACTNKCPCCYANSKDEKFKHANINTINLIIDELAKAEIQRVSLLGGDPALHPHIIDIAKRLRAFNIAVSLMSNTMDLPVSVEESVKYIDLYETTIHGSNKNEHDEYCGKNGAYELLIGNLKKLCQFNVKIGIAINVIPQTSSLIYNMLRTLVEYERLNISYVILQRIIPFGRADKSSSYILSKTDIENALADVYRVHEELKLDITVEDPFPLCIIDERYRKFMHPCEWGYTKAALNGDGDLTRCGADPRYLLGNIFTTPINELWNTSPILKKFREKSYLPDKCQKCTMLDICGGGCPLSSKTDSDVGIDYLISLHGET